MNEINAKKIQSKLPWYEKWQKAITIKDKEKQDKAKLKLFQKEVATLHKNQAKGQEIYTKMAADILPLSNSNNTAEYRDKIINNTLAYCEKLDEKFYQSFERIGMVDWQKNALTDLKEKLGELKNNYDNEKKDQKKYATEKINTKKDFGILDNLHTNALKELQGLQEDFKKNKNKYDILQKKTDQEKGLRYRWNKFTGAYQKEVQHSYHEWIQKVVPRQQANSKSMALATQKPLFKDIQQKHQALNQLWNINLEDNNLEDKKAQPIDTKNLTEVSSQIDKSNNEKIQQSDIQKLTKFVPQIDELLSESPEAMKKEGLFLVIDGNGQSYRNFQKFHNELKELKKAIKVQNKAQIKDSIKKLKAPHFIADYDNLLKNQRDQAERYSEMLDKVPNDHIEPGVKTVNLYALQRGIIRL
jgi:hypothetical protein